MSHETVVRLAAGVVLVGVAFTPFVALFEQWKGRQMAKRYAAPRPCAGGCGRLVDRPHVECEDCHDARQW